MPFPYYYKLSPAAKKLYRESDEIKNIPLDNPENLFPTVYKLHKALEDNKRKAVERLASELCQNICNDLRIDPLTVKISSRRPSDEEEELQGLYEFEEGEVPVLTVWMKTAARGQVVAFKSFIRTVLHELCHHIDYRYFQLTDSLHTEGFFKRESFLYKQIVPLELQKKKAVKKKTSPAEIKKKTGKKSEQLILFDSL